MKTRTLVRVWLQRSSEGWHIVRDEAPAVPGAVYRRVSRSPALSKDIARLGIVNHLERAAVTKTIEIRFHRKRGGRS